MSLSRRKPQFVEGAYQEAQVFTCRGCGHEVSREVTGAEATRLR
jgi:hypothetical protein